MVHRNDGATRCVMSDTVRDGKNSSTHIASENTTDKGTPNRNLAQGQQTDNVLTDTSYFDPVLNVFSTQ
jgi:hypothetical protein